MIDIHTHILPGLDDGAQEMTDSLDLARLAIANGITTMVATPHIGWPATVSPTQVTEKVTAVREALAQSKLTLAIVPGGELQLDPELTQKLRAGHALPIGNGPYVLVELPMWNYPNYTEQTIFDLQIAGYIPVLAHPERCAGFQKDIKLLFKLVERGVLVQITAASILGKFGPSIKILAETLLTRNLAHIIASDSHSVSQRPPVLTPAVERAAELIGKTEAEAMVTTTPAAVVNGEPVKIPEPIVQKPRKRWGIL